MNGLLVFNSANDVVFQQFNADLAVKIRQIAMEQGLLPPAEDNSAAATTIATAIDANIILQIFSPIINSQRIMHCQFDNTYASFQCENDLNFAFGELLGYTFIKIAQCPVDQLKRSLGNAIALSRYLFGANLFATATSNAQQQQLLASALHCYENQLYPADQCMLLEACTRLLLNPELKRAVHNTLQLALECLRQQGQQRTHCMLFVSHKFVSICSSKDALRLSSADMLFLHILTRALQCEQKQLVNRSVAVFLQGIAHNPHSGCIPCIAHFAQLEKGMVLIQIVEYGNLQVASSIYDTFFVLQKIVSVQLQADADALKPAYESLETFVKQTVDAIKRAKLKAEEVENALKKFVCRWENLRKLYGEFLKSFERELLMRIESNMPVFMEELRTLFTLCCCDSTAVALEQLPVVAATVEGKLLEFSEFLAVKAERNISIEAYLEDFPGLIHFILVNRSTGLMIAPDLRSNQLLPKQQLWRMLEFTRNYLKKGQSSIMWSDRTFHYSYFLWFEDQSSGSLKSVDLQQHFAAHNSAANAFRPPYEPGLLAFDYYQQLSDICFPKVAPGKIKCYELYCIHLGLVTATCAAEHARRLVATIADVVGEDSF